ncbi:MAG TPA: FecR domain-containing protein [Devosia sp.]|nr:FecR domain-containing protein [Devosia sp.]
MLNLVTRIAALAVLTALAVPALAANPTGKALGVDPDARTESSRAARTLVVGDDVFIGDRIVTDAKGLVQIMFSDDTKLVVGPHSALLIEDYLLRDNGRGGKLAINALSGTFRFITGGSAKNKYAIETPTGTIGVRGTAFDFFVTPQNTYILQLHGTSIDCPNATPNDCAVLESACQMGILDPQKFEVLKHTDELTGDQRAEAKEMFRLAFSQGDLMRQFRVAGAERCLRREATSAPQGNSMSSPNEGEQKQPQQGGCDYYYSCGRDSVGP